ncbi:hypothetical protein [Burkholderia cenocepacia]|uniref:hypothetical protein n=1 Tax=Burkholderia cenocepacia TaxID=95486 RepID=UPI00158D7D7B|nr:hypothetical protein [Burkholderia cenocepacia]
MANLVVPLRNSRPEGRLWFQRLESRAVEPRRRDVTVGAFGVMRERIVAELGGMKARVAFLGSRHGVLQTVQVAGRAASARR